MEKRLGQRKGDIPRYLDWKEKPRRMRSSLKCSWRSWSRDFQGDEQGKELHHLGLGEVAPALEGALQERQELFEFVAVVGDEAVEACGVVRGDGADCLFHALVVGGREELAASPEDEAVLRVQASHRDLAVEVVAGCREDLFENLRVEEEGWAYVELEAILFHGGRATADDGPLFDDGDLNSGFCEQDCGCEPPRSGSYDDDPARILLHLLSAHVTRL